MKFPLDRADRLAALRIIAIYALFASLWIYFSDNALGMLIRDPDTMVRLSVYKGFLFIIVTSLILYQLISRDIRKTRTIEKELRLSRNLIDSLIEGTTDAVFVKDPEGHYILINSATAHFMGRPASEVIGKDDAEIFAAEDAEGIMAGDKGVMAGGTAITYEDYITTADGVYRTFLSTKGPVFDSSGEVCGLFGISRDISGRKQAEEEIREKGAEMERFTYMISHDLKSPLITIKTFLGFLSQDLERSDRERAVQDMLHIGSAADKMGLLLDELRELSRIGRMTNPPVRVCFRELVNEAVGLVAGQVANQRVEIRVEGEQVQLTGDRPRLVEIWQNLVENAVKYMGNQQVPVLVIGSEGTGKDTLFYVRDNGMGIDPSNRDKVFELFAMLDPASEGTGLGLALTKKIVDLYGGRIWVESEGLGHGACFRFTLPQAVEVPENAQ
jgi:PAS domain S-box-containing protein